MEQTLEVFFESFVVFSPVLRRGVLTFLSTPQQYRAGHDWQHRRRWSQACSDQRTPCAFAPLLLETILTFLTLQLFGNALKVPLDHPSHVLAY